MYFIAEIGHNHQGSFELAKKLIDSAKGSGADCVKFQKRQNSELYHPVFAASRYTGPNSFGLTYGEHRAALELKPSQYSDLVYYCRDDVKIDLMVTVFDKTSLKFCEGIKIKKIKIASGTLTNLDLLYHLKNVKDVEIFMSVGGSTLEEIYTALDILHSQPNVTILHCVPKYPCPLNDLEIGKIGFLQSAFPKYEIGMSDHCPDIESALMAQTVGATVIEKHFTFDRSAKGSDHSFSLTPELFKKMVDLCKSAERACQFFPVVNFKVSNKMQHGAYANRDLEPGDVMDGAVDYLIPYQKGQCTYIEPFSEARVPIKAGQAIEPHQIYELTGTIDGLDGGPLG